MIILGMVQQVHLLCLLAIMVPERHLSMVALQSPKCHTNLMRSDVEGTKAETERVWPSSAIVSVLQAKPEFEAL